MDCVLLPRLEPEPSRSCFWQRPPPKGTVEGHYPIRATFDVEGRMYDMMPRMLDLLLGAGRAEPPLGPRMLYRQREPDPLLVFEDISVQVRLVPVQQGRI